MISLVIDCGTTNLRVSALSQSGAVLHTAKREGGVRHTAIDGHNGHLRASLTDALAQAMGACGVTAHGVSRCVAYGMITSNVGLLEVPHVVAPADAQALRAHMRVARFEDIAPLDITFIPGVRNFSGEVGLENFAAMDMMRGEETEAVGLHALLSPEKEALFILPGSHNKFVRMNAHGQILGCMTSISGELLDAITHDTLLADAVGHEFVSAGQYVPLMACAGARECVRSGLGRAAFAGRILSALGKQDKPAIQSYLLGAALALDVQAMRAFMGDAAGATAVYVAGKAPVQQAMCDVLDALDMPHAVQVSPAHSARMGLCGAMRIAY